MRAILLPFLLLLLTAGLNPLSAQREVILPAHTPIQLATNGETVAADVQAGDLVTLRVLLDVKVDGETIIRNGAFAQAQVRLRYADARRKKPELILSPTTVQAANGTLIPLYGDGLLFGGRGRAARPAIPNGKTVSAAVRYGKKLFFE